jgi:sigma-B regulation protein RsbU (phosphoserine phosphatase)
MTSRNIRRSQRFGRGLAKLPPGPERRTRRINWIPLFRDADPFAVDAALTDAEVLELAPGSPLLQPGATNQSIYIVLSGTVTAHLDAGGAAGSAIPIPVGECIGELSTLDGKPVSALVMAQDTVRVLVLSREMFWNRLMILPGVAGNLMLTLTERMRRTNELALSAQRQQLELKHLRKELDVARQLQASMLPLQRPLFPDRNDIDICGTMEPADDIGGDLFDAFFVDPQQLFFCIGDVSGHGIAAALFMSRTIGLLHTLATNTRHPGELLRLLNERLCVGNDTNIFVTLFCGYLDLPSGRLVYANGGHPPPMLLQDGVARLIEVPDGVLIGALSDMEYAERELDLAPDALLLCSTDGATEAQNAAGEEYSEERCLDFLQRSDTRDLAQLLDALRTSVTDFTGSTSLDDDCTLLALRRRR